MITDKHLAAAQARVLEARAAVLTAQKARDRLVLQAVAEGWSQHRIARALGIAQPSVQELIQRVTARASTSRPAKP